MAQYRVTFTTREQHEATVDTDHLEDFEGDPDDIESVAAYFESLEEYEVDEYVQGDRSWFNTIETEFDDIYPVEETNG
jgi:hypothetical protein